MFSRKLSLMCLLIAFFLGCEPNSSLEKNSTLILKYIQDSTINTFYVPANIYANSIRVQYYDSLSKAYPFEADKHHFYKGIEHLHKGDNQEAIHIFERLQDKRQQNGMLISLADYEEDWLEDYLALAFLRLGEQENCIENHSASSCILPINSKGIHSQPLGSEKAILQLESILKAEPLDYNSIWLLNLAYMTLGKYPAHVPDRWLIPPEAFQSEYPLKTFTDVAQQVGLASMGLAGGCIVDDFNNDNYLDVILSEWHPDGSMSYFQNNKKGGFDNLTNEAGIHTLHGGTNLIQGDYNNDGWLDFFVMRGGWLYDIGNHPNSLLKNNGDGTFTDVTVDVGLLSFHPSQTATWRDFNNDGWLDLFVGNESFGEGEAFHPCELFISQQNGTFKEVASQAGIMVSDNSLTESYFVKGVTSTDYNNDGLQDIFISAFNSDKTNLLFKNTGIDSLGIPHFQNVTLQAGLKDKFASFPTWFWDYDQDGLQDIFVAGYDRKLTFGSISAEVAKEYLNIPTDAERAKLYKNNGDGTFTDKSNETGLARIIYAMGANFGDLDNDGFPDFYAGTGEVNLNSVIPNRMFRNHQGSMFQDVTSAGGFGHIQKGHGIAFADLDNDGDQDVFAVMGGAYEGDIFQNVLFCNPYEQDKGWISLLFEGTKSNRSAIGTKIRIVVRQKNQIKEIFTEVNSGGSFGCNPLRQHIGLDNANNIDTLEVLWQGNPIPQIFTNLRPKQFYRLREGGASPELLDVTTVNFQKEEILHQHHLH